MKHIAIVSQGRSHLLNLARYLETYKDLDVTFYTMMPKSRCKKNGYNGRVVSIFFPIGIASLLIEKIPFINPYQRSRLRIKLRILFDILMSFRLRHCDFLIGLNGTAVQISKIAKRKYDSVTICDQGSSHILTQDAVRRTYSDSIPPALNTEYMLKHYECVDYLMTPATYVKTTDLNNGISQDRLLYNPYGVDTSLFTPTIKPSSDSYDVIMVGSWWKHKGCDMLIEACINILDLKVLHVGTVIDCDLPNTPKFQHVEFVKETELPGFYAQAKIFVMPSLDEGFGLVLLQAASCGLPIVGSSRTGVSDIAALLADPSRCITIDEPLSVESIVDAVKKALDVHKALPAGERIQFNGKVRNISWESYGARYYDILKTL